MKKHNFLLCTAMMLIGTIQNSYAFQNDQAVAPAKNALQRTPVRPQLLPSTPPAAAPQVATAQAGSVSEATWPQRFELESGESTGFGFIVSQPGPIAITVQWQGTPLSIRLKKPSGEIIERPGNGKLSIDYNATLDDIKKGTIWSVSLRSAQAAQKTEAGAIVHDKPVRLEKQALATGSITIQHPPGDMQRAQAEINARAKPSSLSNAQNAPQTAPAISQIVAQKQAALQKQQTTRQTIMLEQIKKLPATTSKWQLAPQPATRQFNHDNIKNTKQPQQPQTTQTQSAAVGVVGANQPATVANPAITSLSTSDGQPGDPVLINGNSFFANGGEVHFVVGPNPQHDLKGNVSSWSDKQIFVMVPDAAGVTSFNGLVYVKQGNVISNKVPFHFSPSLEFRVLDQNTPDRNVKPAYLINSEVCHPACAYGLNLGFLLFGGKSDDEYYRNTLLKNGWVVDSAYIAHLQWQNGSSTDLLGPGRTEHADAYISEIRAGTNSPYAKVHWWYDAGNGTSYALRVVIKGPKGVPHF